MKVTPEDGGEILHISQVCMSKPVDGNRTYLKIVQGSQSFAACVLQRDKQESCSVDLFLSAREGIQLALEGGKNELSVIGYFEPEPESESEDEGDMAGFEGESEEESEEEDLSEDETDGMTAPVIRVSRAYHACTQTFTTLSSLYIDAYILVSKYPYLCVQTYIYNLYI